MLVTICTYASNWRHVGKFLGLIVEWYTPHNQLHTDTQKIINSKIMLLYRFGICLSAAATTNTSINNGYLVFVSLKLKLYCYYLSILDSGRRVIYYLFSHGIILPKITSFFLGGGICFVTIRPSTRALPSPLVGGVDRVVYLFIISILAKKQKICRERAYFL